MTVIRNGFQNADLDIPVVLPTLNLDFANSQSLDERITFSRGSIGTFVNKNGLIETAAANIPRFDYDPISGECRGLLIEESRQNLLTYSEDFGDASWSKGQTSIFTNSVTSPDGTINADTLTPNTVNAQHSITKSVSGLSDNTIYTSSIFIKKFGNQFSWCRLTLRSKDGTFTGVYFNVDTKQFGSSIGGALIVSYGYVEYPNSWIRLYITTNTSTGATTPNYIFWVANGNGVLSYSYSDSQTDGFYIWGAQLETGAFPTSYIPTAASTVTRSADNASMTGTNFSSWYNQTESTIFCEFNAYQLMNSQRNVFTIGAPVVVGLINRIELQLNPSTQNFIYHNIYQNSGTLADYFGFSYTTGPTKNIMRYKDLDTFVASKDGNIRSNTSKTKTIPLTKNMNSLTFGTFNGAISRFAYYPKALNDAEIQYLTQ